MARRGEFDLVRTRLVPLTRNHKAALGLNDDAAVLDPPAGCELVLACDTLVAGVHFLQTDPPEVAAMRAMRSNLSDLAAMGADPLGYLSAIAWPRDIAETWQDRFLAAWARDQERFGCVLLGGDTTSTPGPLTVTMTLIGTVPDGRAVTRAGARAGEDVWVSGSIGDAALGLAAVQDEAGAPAALRHRYECPEPRLALGRALRGLASAAIDVSDGLVADARHLAGASGIAMEIDAEAVPLSADAGTWLESAGERGLVRLLTAGDDYELLFTAPAECRGEIDALAGRAGVPLTRIGHAGEGEGVRLRDRSGRPVEAGAGGFTHF
jgi:thiamine-monophosphate kinase